MMKIKIIMLCVSVIMLISGCTVQTFTNTTNSGAPNGKVITNNNKQPIVTNTVLSEDGDIHPILDWANRIIGGTI